MEWLLIPTHAAAMVAWFYFVKREVRVNAEMIAADGSANTLHESFHLQRTEIRAVVAIFLVWVATTPLWGRGLTTGLSLGGLLLLFGGYFLRVFNPQLNLARGLPADYVSSAAHSAAFDRLIWWLTNKLHGGVALPGDVSNTYWLVLNAAFWGSVVGYLTCVALLCIWQ